MTRCGGVAGACTCVVQAGAGIAVTGDGSVDTPYRVSQAAADVHVSGQPAGTVGTTVTGDGSAATPYVVAADAVFSADTGNALGTGSDGGLYVATPADPGAVTASSLVSADPANIVRTGNDALLYAPDRGWRLSTVVSDNGNGTWQVTIDGAGTTQYTAWILATYTPVVNDRAAAAIQYGTLMSGTPQFLLLGKVVGQ